VLLLILDTVRAQSLSLYGYARPTTPNLVRMAADGVVFESAFSTAPWTLPAHASMFTGRYPHELSTGWTTGLDAKYPTLAELLTQNGYRTAGFVANQLYGPPAFGLGRGFAHYDVFPRTLPYTLYHSNLVRFGIARVNGWANGYYSPLRKTAEQINDAFLSWLSDDQSRPFFAFLNYYDAHDPYAPPKPFDRKFLDAEPLTRRTNPGRHTAEEVKGLQDAYDGAIAYLDSEIGRLYDELKSRGILNNTLIIVTSDHGEEFAEHTVLGHGNSVYATALHVPLLIMDPKHAAAGKRVSEAVTTRDLSATVIDLIGVSASWPGQSLTRTWNDGQGANARSTSPILAVLPFSKNLPDWYPVSNGDLRSLLSDPYHYIRNGNGREELYDIRRDPWEKNDLAKVERVQTAVSTLRRQTDSLLGTTTDAAGSR
jgi:arylsulfatase A-like enzyme